jgi:hypothetical protein
MDEDDALSFDTSTAITAAAHNNLEEPLSLIEKTALRVKPILEEVMKRMIKEDNNSTNAFFKQSEMSK